MRLIISSLYLFTFIFFAQNSIAQGCLDEIKDVPIDIMEVNAFKPDSQNEFFENLKCFVGEELDSIDIELLSNGPMLASIYINSVSENEENNDLTYGRIYTLFLKTKNEYPAYSKLRELHILSQEVDLLPAIYSNWGKVKSFLTEIHMTEQDLEPLRVYLEANENPNKTMKEFRMEYQKVRLKLYEEFQRSDESTNRNELIERLFTKSKAINVESLINSSLEEDQPILLYFTGYNCVNCRKIEQTVLHKDLILNELADNFIFTSLYVDDQSALSENQTFEIDGRQQLAKTVGDLNMYFEISEFQIANQPFFVALAPDGKILGTTSYQDSKNHQDFMDFLTEVKDLFGQE